MIAKSPIRAHSQSGFSLIEVLVTMVVIALGLLGFAGLQVHSLKSNRISMQRSQATILASDILDRMRANRANAASYALALNANASGTTVVAQDLIAWEANLASSLPSGNGAVDVANNPTVNIQVQWTENGTTHTWNTQTRL